MNLEQARLTLETLHPAPDALFEIRTVSNPVMSGYFRNKEKALSELSRHQNETFYVVFNEIDIACYSREQCERLISRPKLITTSDANITGYDWVLIDFDPKRASGTSSSEKEKSDAKEVMKTVWKHLQTQGFSEPVFADSGNGWHLLYHVHFSSDEAHRETVKSFLSALDLMFSTETVSIDTAIYNPARITKLYGSMTRKGANTEERPHRESSICFIPEKIEPTRYDLIQQIAQFFPKPIAGELSTKYGTQFSLTDFMSKNGLHVAAERRTGSGTKYILDTCPFCAEHKAPDAAIFQSSSGAIGFHCFHNSCSDRTWRDVRLLFEPDAYDRHYQPTPPPPPNKQISTDIQKILEKPKPTGAPPFYTLTDIMALPKKQSQYIKTGITKLDKRMRGFAKGEITVLSGLPGAGKTNLLSMLALNIVEQGYRVAFFSGELIAQRTARWINLIAAGKPCVTPTEYENYFYVSDEICKKIADWTSDRLFVYNNDLGNEFLALCERLNECVTKHKIDVIFLDNLMALDLSALDRDTYEQQKKFMNAIKRFAEANNIHILFVAHPRKPQGFLRVEDISGTAEIRGWVDNALLLHRVGNDYKRLAKEMFKWSDNEPQMTCTNALEIAKDRESGAESFFIPLYYENESKRLKNERSEFNMYGWYTPGEFADDPF